VLKGQRELINPGEEKRKMSIAVAVPAPRGSYREMWLITLGHSLTHWYPATFYLILPIIARNWAFPTARSA